MAAIRPTQRPAAPDPDGRAPVVLFDLDRTLLPGSSLLHLARVLADRGVLTRGAMARHVASNLAFQQRGAGRRRVQRTKESALRAVAGAEHAMLLEAAVTAGAAVADSLYPAARRLVSRHVEAGHFCVILSAAPQELVAVVSDRLGAHLAVGSLAGVRDGRLTGQMDGPFCYGEGKLVRLASELGPVDLERAYAYADSASDLPVLAACGRPVAVNPDRRLRRVAERGGWPILQFRKARRAGRHEEPAAATHRTCWVDG